MSNMTKALKQAHSELKFKNRTDLKEKTFKTLSKYLKNSDRTFMLYEDMLCVEFIKYVKLEKQPKYLNLFEKLILEYKNSSIFDGPDFYKLMEKLFCINEKACDNFLLLSENENYPKFTSRYDELHAIMNGLGELLEKSLYKHMTSLCALMYYKKTGNIVKHTQINTFGKVVNTINKNDPNAFYLNDFIYGVPLNQLRNICIHKDYELISYETVKVQYQGVTKEINYPDILIIFKDISKLNTALALFFNLVYLDIIPDLNKSNIPDSNVRAVNSFAYLFFNISTLGFNIKKYGYNKSKDSYEIIFEDKDNSRRLQNSIMFLSKFATSIADGLDSDKVENIKPNVIKMILVNKGRFVATASIPYIKALELYSAGKQDEEVIANTKFTMTIRDKKC